ncbi:MAG TPA: hypothetical protein VFX43_10825 [Chitinophagaceae bacterium]|nr:hypothetical protein [Chitinophagaceae bacterium]
MEPYRFHKKHSIDLIPFGAIAQDGTVVLDNPPMELSVYGCKEVTEEAVVVTKHFKVVTLAGLCILKLIAYSERPEYRSKDLEDYFFIVVNYYQIAGEELFNGQYDDLIEGDFEVNIASARMLGRNMALVLNKNETLKNSVINILMQQLQGFTEPEIDQMYKVRDEDNNLVVKLKLVFETIKGIKDIVHDPN